MTKKERKMKELEMVIDEFAKIMWHRKDCDALEDIRREALLHNKSVFDKLLIRAAMEGHVDKLWNLGILLIVAVREIEITKSDIAQRQEQLIELTETLLFLTENKDKVIRMSEPRGKSVNLTGKSTIELIIKCLLNEFKKDELNEIPMTEERARILLESGQKDEWINDYLIDGLAKGMCVNIDNKREMIDDEMIDCFCLSNTEIVDDVTVDILKTVFAEMSDKEKPKGAPPKNYHIACLLKHILPLLDGGITSKNCRFIFEYCVFFNLIQGEIERPEQYIRNIYDEHKEAILKNKFMSWIDML